VPREAIAIVGISALFPGSSDEQGFWRDIQRGRDLITDVPPQRWLIEDHYDPDPAAEDKTYCKRGAFLSPSSFDALEFAIPPHAIPATDTCQLLALLLAKRVLEDVAHGQRKEIDGERTSVILGVTSGQQLFLEVTSRLGRPVWVKALRESGIPESQVKEICDRIAASYVPWQEATFPGLLGNVVAGRIAHRFDLHGTNCVTDAACASSLAAISMAVDELRLGRSDLVITGGADTFNDVSMFVAFSKTPALSPTGDCRPFSDRADGTVLGEGIALFALKRLSDAEREGNPIYAVLRAIGSSSDGRSKSIYAPLAAGQARAMLRAYEEARYGPESIDLVEAHGTGTAAGDAAEIESLRLVFESAGGGRRNWCALGSVKSQVGHTKAAAGAASLFKTAMALHHQVLPPTIKVERPNPALRLEESPFYLNTAVRPWIPQSASGRRAAVSAFGFGGTNFHMVLEEYTGPAPRPKRVWPGGSELVLLSAADPDTLRQSCLQTAALCEREKTPLQSIALASQYEFQEWQPHRAAVVASDAREMSRRLRHLAAGQNSQGAVIGTGSFSGKLALLFPGQGSQYLNMGLDLATAFRAAMAVWEKAADVAWMVFPPRAFTAGESDRQSRNLTATEWAQPAIGVASAALLAVLRSLGVQADCVAGHSFGEISALFAAGAIDLETMLALSRRRGELMRDCASEPAGMLSVRSSWRQIHELLADLAVTPANHNGPEQVVLSGPMAPLREAERRLRASGFTVSALPVATAFHSPLMQPAADALQQYLNQLRIGSPRLPFYSNRDGAMHSYDGRVIAEDLAAQVASPVLFGEMIERMYADGVRIFVEVGPRDVLTTLVGSALKGREHQAIALDRPAQDGLGALWQALGALAVSGIAMNWRRFREEHRIPPDPAEPKLSVLIDGGNYGRPYPPPGGKASLPQPILQPASSQTPASPDSAEAYRVFQESITAAHRDWQTNLAKGQEAFLRSMEAAFRSATGNPAAIPPASAGTLQPAAIPAESATPERTVSARHVLWEIVAEKTGYPADMLQPAMALEADLGIDSIKRVEIFSALQERYPSLSASDPEPWTGLRTLGDIVSALDGAGSPLFSPASENPRASSSRNIIWEIVSEKTGYPADMLEPAMALEADLGIDSIKRVEILSALQERFPELAQVDQTALSTLRTLGDVITALERNGQPGQLPSAAPQLPKRYRIAYRPSPRAGQSMLYPGDRVVISEDSCGVSTALAGLLQARGFPAAIANGSPDANVWICLTALQPCHVDGSMALELHREAWLFAKAASGRLAASEGAFLTVQDPARPWSGGVAALAKTAGLEWPAARVKAIRIATADRLPADIADSILEEILTGGPDREVELDASGSRTVPEIVETGWDGPIGAARLPANPVLVVTGGARGITAACVKAVAKTLPARFVLFGRTSLAEEPAATRACSEAVSIGNALADVHRTAGGSITPTELRERTAQILACREIRQTIQELEREGAAVRYCAADMRVPSIVRAALEEVRREWGPIHGVIHAAGIIADKLIADLAPEQFDIVFSTKVEGLRVLLEATQQDPLAMLCFFSSIAATYGNRGQAAYAIANEVLNEVALAEARRRAETCMVRSIAWGPWAGGMVTPALAQRFRASNVPLIGLAEGAECFVKEVLSGDSQALMVIGGPTPEAPQALQLRIRRETHPHLDDHRIQNVPVLPVVEAVRMLLNGASAQGRMEQSACCANIKVLHGVRLDAFQNGGNVLMVQHCGAGTFELVSPDGTRHYQATMVVSTEPLIPPPDPGPLSTAPWRHTDIYGKFLFHGPEFHLISNIEGISENGIAGILRPRDGELWRQGEGGYDAGMLDGGLQLARLWGFWKLGQPTLPMRIGCIRVVRDPGKSPVECRVFASTGTNRISCDMGFYSPEKELLTLMTGVEMYATPGA
jgi:acyl transferase domain-containing protein/NAD(P)-dependent dehydrogenase (short-subunit alcohol dehydrogenase family)